MTQRSISLIHPLLPLRPLYDPLTYHTDGALGTASPKEADSLYRSFISSLISPETRLIKQSHHVRVYQP